MIAIFLNNDCGACDVVFLWWPTTFICVNLIRVSLESALNSAKYQGLHIYALVSTGGVRITSLEVKLKDSFFVICKILIKKIEKKKWKKKRLEENRKYI